MKYLLFISCIFCLLCPTVMLAEQKQRLGSFEVHYVVVPSTFFDEKIAERYGIVRGRDRALMNLSILDQQQQPTGVTLSGEVTNLLEQRNGLDFREISEGDAIYYLAEIRHTDRETLRFHVEITTPDGITRALKFQQQMFWEGR